LPEVKHGAYEYGASAAPEDFVMQDA